ncbi:hypothetical protein EDB81DRAFT_844817 [Dactylonectria macrodidyma]|uniref:F-box domain-containing protein n=1 Tax=Dactylonectria macrodidyma TaxID=307937 RepID=A0A9P9EB41_9HYPO|nr:hypothetical protein EDB81DRAFT_844817 [Dactylonectria macrodidyma]
MRLPNEAIQQIYLLLSPRDYNAARHTGGWWSSILQLMAPLSITRLFSLDQERIISKWISRECSLADVKKSAFKEVGYTAFNGLVPGSTVGALHGALVFTVSLCGRFLLATHGQMVYVYELNHVCSGPGSTFIGSTWPTGSVPLRPRERKMFGVPRPVATVVCPRQVISCSMDTSAGRHAVAVLMEGRMGMVCSIMTERAATCRPTTANLSHEATDQNMHNANSVSPPRCVCQAYPVSRAPPIEEGPRSVYRRICHPDDPPRSVALCPQRNCVAFGCTAGIELHWVDALTNQGLSRWFPLASPSDYLYFLPARRGVDTPKRLRLISSAAALGDVFGPFGDMYRGFGTSYVRSGTNGVVSVMGAGARGTVIHDIHSISDLPSQRSCVRSRDLLDQWQPCDGLVRRVSASSADHYRAVPLSDGYHILFTDPKTGNLCLGTDAPFGSLNRLIRKVWFRPPSATSSPLPMLYTTGADTRHGVRVAAAFSVKGGDAMRLKSDEATSSKAAPQSGHGSDEQIVVFYTIPPDMFHDISQGSICPSKTGAENEEVETMSEWADWRPEERYREIDIFGDPFQASAAAYPLEIQGQPVAICSNLVELALDSGPDMVLWAFSAEGWARTWTMHVGREEVFARTAVQHDGSVRHVDPDGDIVMAEVETSDTSDIAGMTLPLLDGAACRTRWTNTPRERYRRLLTGKHGDRMSGTVSVDLVEEVSGITRMDVELR